MGFKALEKLPKIWGHYLNLYKLTPHLCRTKVDLRTKVFLQNLKSVCVCVCVCVVYLQQIGEHDEGLFPHVGHGVGKAGGDVGDVERCHVGVAHAQVTQHHDHVAADGHVLALLQHTSKGWQAAMGQLLMLQTQLAFTHTHTHTRRGKSGQSKTDLQHLYLT